MLSPRAPRVSPFIPLVCARHCAGHYAWCMGFLPSPHTNSPEHTGTLSSAHHQRQSVPVTQSGTVTNDAPSQSSTYHQTGSTQAWKWLTWNGNVSHSVGPGSCSEILAVGAMADDKKLPRLGWKYGGPRCIMFPFRAEEQFGITLPILLISCLVCAISFILLSLPVSHSNFHDELFATWYTSSKSWSPEAFCGPQNQTRGLNTAAQSMSLGRICSSVSPITHTLPCPPSIPPFLSIPHLLHSHTHNSPCAERWMGCSQTTGAALLVGIFHHTVQTCSFFFFLLFIVATQWRSLLDSACEIMRRMENY